ncbi:MAG: DUF3244 domain-containing protein [Prevotella sp.]|nr:DUF3244 domain-containing protein [Prevotella sp.]
MKKLLSIFILFFLPMLASATTVSDVKNSGCLDMTRGDGAESLLTIVLTKEGSVLSVQLLNYESNCGTTDFNVTSAVSGGSDSEPCSVNISVVPVVPAEMDCICPYNVSFTVRDVEVNSFYLSCWWYKGQVELTEGEPLVLEYKVENVTTDDLDYIPFVEMGKQWHVVISYDSPYYGGSIPRYWMYEEVERNGKTYAQTYRLNDELCEYQEAGLFCEENRRVYKYDEKAGRDIMLYDFTLKEGDTFTYECGFDQPVDCKVLKEGWLEDGPKIVTSCTLTPADTLDIKYRSLRTWTIGRKNGMGEYDEVATWVECIGALENVFGLIDNGYMKFDYDLAYVERKDHETGYGKNEYLPFSFYSTSMHGCNLPTGESDGEYDDGLHHLTYELEGDRLHIYGDIYTQCGPNNYAYFYEKPTRDPSVHEIVFQPWEVAPVADCMDYHHTDFYVPGFDPNLNYYVLDNRGMEEHPVINKTAQTAYRPFIEDDKVWKVGSVTSGNPVQLVEYYYFDGDTIIGGKPCKQMMCQRYVTPDFAETNFISQDHTFCYVGAWYEEDKKVFFCNAKDQQFKLMYDFSVDANDTLQINNFIFVVGPKQTGGIKGFKGAYRNVWECGDGESNYRCAPWLEGVGGVYGSPTTNVFNVELADPLWVLMSCTVGDEVIYLNDEYEDGATSESMGVRKRFDFTHTIKTKPKARIKRETSDARISSSEREVARPEVKSRNRSGENQSLYGEYNDLQLGIYLDPLDDAYLVRITDETGNTVYEKSINAGNIVGLNIDISAYAKGRYIVTVENSDETFTGEFDAQTTGIEEVRSKRSEVRSVIYNLQGQRLSTLQKGLNIVNGQKVFVQ